MPTTPPTGATDKLGMLTDAAHRPVLSLPELQLLLQDAQVVDSDGLAPDDDNWEPTYDFNQAASRGWEVKAGRCANEYGFTSDNQTFNRDQVHAHCLEQARLYRNRIVRFVSATPHRRSPEADFCWSDFDDERCL